MIELAAEEGQEELPLEEVPADTENTRGEQAGAEDSGEVVEGEVEVVEGESEGDEPVAIIPTETLEPESLSLLATDDQIERAIKRVLKRIDATKRLKVALLSMTNHRDWCAHKSEGDPDGIPYLQESGAEKVIHAFKIEVEHDGGQREPNPDGGFEYVYNGRMRAVQFSDTWYPVVGSRWSEDGFFTRGGKQRPDPGDVRKAALTNYYNRGIKTVCGLRTLTWEELESIPHLADLRNRVVTIGYESGGSKGGKPGEKSDIAKGPHICVKIAYGDEKNKGKIKRLKPWNWNGDEKYWEVGFTKSNFGTILDMHAEDKRAVRFKCINVPADDLP